jgi:hypothetical protein
MGIRLCHTLIHRYILIHIRYTNGGLRVLPVDANSKQCVDVIFHLPLRAPRSPRHTPLLPPARPRAFLAEGAHMALHTREHRRRNVSYVSMMRRSDFTFLRRQVRSDHSHQTSLATLRRSCVSHPCVAPACWCVKAEGDIPVLFFSTPFCQMEVLCKAMLKDNELYTRCSGCGRGLARLPTNDYDYVRLVLELSDLAPQPRRQVARLFCAHPSMRGTCHLASCSPQTWCLRSQGPSSAHTCRCGYTTQFCAPLHLQLSL